MKSNKRFNKDELHVSEIIDFSLATHLLANIDTLEAMTKHKLLSLVTELIHTDP